MKDVIDKDRVRRRFQASIATYDDAAVVQGEMALLLVEMIAAEIEPETLGHVVELGCGTGLLTGPLLKYLRPKLYTANDLVPDLALRLPVYSGEAPGTRCAFLAGDAEYVDLPDRVDLIASSAMVQWINDVPVFLRRIADRIATGGYIALATLGCGNFAEIAQTGGISLAYNTLPEYCAWLAVDFEILDARESQTRLAFPTPRHMLRHLRDCGVTGLGRSTWNPAQLADFERQYAAQHTDDGQVWLTYCPMHITARRRG